MKQDEFWRLEIGTGTAKYITGKGRVELIQAATKEAGVIGTVPKKGDWFFSLNYGGQWEKCERDYGPGEVRTVIPAPKPEPNDLIWDDPDGSDDEFESKRESCTNCQNATRYIDHTWIEGKVVCKVCHRPPSQWTHSDDFDREKKQSKPESKLCPNCQGARGFRFVRRNFVNGDYQCEICGRPESKWTYAKDPKPKPYKKTFCPECGFGVAVDEEGLCILCGATAVGRAIDKLPQPEWPDLGGIGPVGIGGPL